jgi:CHAD domain-containing protein
MAPTSRGPAPPPGGMPCQHAAEAGRRVFQRHLEQLLSRQYGLAYVEDREFVHEMRVATRRLRAAIKIFRKSFEGGLKAEARQLKKLGDLLGAARDSDVFLEFLTDYQRTAPPKGRPFLTGLINEEKHARARHYQALITACRAQSVQTFLTRWYGRIRRPSGSPDGLPLSKKGETQCVARLAEKALGRHFRGVLEFGRRLDGLDAEELHRLRIACKKLRYAAEFFVPLYPSGLSDLITLMTDVQDLLGEYHDADVYIERLQAYLDAKPSRRADANAQEGFRRVRSFLKRQQRRH